MMHTQRTRLAGIACIVGGLILTTALMLDPLMVPK
jgi:hypothetical protein